MKAKEKKQFFVDFRGGCAAIRNRLHPDYEPEYPGLHGDTPDVVKYVMGTPEGAIKVLLNKQCAWLNKQNPKFVVISDYPKSTFNLKDRLECNNLDDRKHIVSGKYAMVNGVSWHESEFRKYPYIFKEIIELPETTK